MNLTGVKVSTNSLNDHHAQNFCTSPVSSVSSRTSPLPQVDLVIPHLSQPIMNGPIIENKVRKCKRRKLYKTIVTAGSLRWDSFSP